MTKVLPPLIIPVEGQVRELDAKILLASVAARRGFPVVIGRRRSIDLRIDRYPRSVYLAKDFDSRAEYFGLMRNLGHEVVAFDEEALVRFPDAIHFAKRMSPISIRQTSALLAWGPSNEALWRRWEGLPDDLPIHVTGNPRFDLLRPEFRAYFAADADALRDAHGDFILINTNFPLVNAKQGIFLPAETPGGERPLGRGGHGMTREFGEHMERHKLAVLESYRQMIPELDRAFPELTIVIRPHPSEFPKVYHRIAAQCERVKVIHEGNVVPWLMAAKATIHNGCTTGVESNLLDVPTIAYGPTNGGGCDFGESFRLPSLLSHQCADFESLYETVKGILEGELHCAAGEEHERLLREHLAPRTGALAAERIADVLEDHYAGISQPPEPALLDRLSAWRTMSWRRVQSSRLKKKVINKITRKQAREPELKRRGFRELSVEDMRARFGRFQRILGESEELRVEQVSRNVFRVSA